MALRERSEVADSVQRNDKRTLKTHTSTHKMFLMQVRHVSRAFVEPSAFFSLCLCVSGGSTATCPGATLRSCWWPETSRTPSWSESPCPNPATLSCRSWPTSRAKLEPGGFPTSRSCVRCKPKHKPSPRDTQTLHYTHNIPERTTLWDSFTHPPLFLLLHLFWLLQKATQTLF